MVISLFHRHKLKQLILKSIISTSVLIALVWISQSVKFFQLISTHNISLWVVIKLSFLILPLFLNIILPISTLIIIINIYKDMFVSHEITILRNIGMSNLYIARPFLIFTSWISLLLLLNNFFIMPYCSDLKNKSNYDNIKATSSYNIIANQFNIFGNLMIYHKGIKKDNYMSNVFISIIKSPEPNLYFINYRAKQGKIISANNQLILVIKNGSMQTFKDNRLTNTKFKQLSLDLTGPGGARGKPPVYTKNQTTFKLLQMLNDTEIKSALKNEAITELHNRLFNSIYIFSWVLLVIFFIGLLSYSRNMSIKSNVIVSGLAILILGTGIIIIKQLPKHLILLIPLYILMFVIPVLLFYLIYKNSKRELK